MVGRGAWRGGDVGICGCVRGVWRVWAIAETGTAQPAERGGCKAYWIGVVLCLASIRFVTC